MPDFTKCSGLLIQPFNEGSHARIPPAPVRQDQVVAGGQMDVLRPCFDQPTFAQIVCHKGVVTYRDSEPLHGGSESCFGVL